MSGKMENMTQQPWPILERPAPLPSDTFGNPDESNRFVVLIEQTVGSGETQRWGVPDAPIRVPGGRPAAQQMAAQLAANHKPRHPMMEQGRWVYRISDDQYLSVVQGATATFHFRVSVAELL